ncbi:hypothetical protein U9M48_000827 [Paspalum notatum var. saurae]|uniref:Knottins-like domain-containing protein n=1 Tax=Paspalum notatum var. saurae TaxID=547442 RepID=A0AAQ3PE58_PASNO
MDSSRRNILASAAVLLLIVCMATEMMLVQAHDVVKNCMFGSKDFKGWCMSNKKCNSVCLNEASRNLRGQCDGPIGRECVCIAPCLNKN